MQSAGSRAHELSSFDSQALELRLSICSVDPIGFLRVRVLGVVAVKPLAVGTQGRWQASGDSQAPKERVIRVGPVSRSCSPQTAPVLWEGKARALAFCRGP